MFGLGALQDFDKALKYFKLGATNGDKDSVIRVSQLYFNKVTLSLSGKEFAESFMNAYAYMKIAQSLPGEIKIIDHDGKILNPIQLISKMQELDYFKPYLKKADVLAKQICLTIKGCRQ